MILLLDNYDSFTYNLVDYLAQCGAECVVIRNDAMSLGEIQKQSFKAIIFSPGPKKPSDAGIMMQLLDYYHNKKPILGICLGHQAMGEYFGGTLEKADYPMHGKTTVITHTGHPTFFDMPHSFEVMRYHSLIIRNIENTPLEAIASTATGEIMAMVHRELPLTGIQFHPESILTQHGKQILRNWLNNISYF